MTRQALYDLIRQTSKDEHILSEMKRLGFWKTAEGEPHLSDDLIQKEGTLNRELNVLLEKERKYESREKMLTEMRKARMEAAKKRREETKLKNQQKRADKAAAWQTQKDQGISYLGEGVSASLRPSPTNHDALAKHNLPHFDSPLALAQAMQITLGRLRFLAFNRKISTTTHYKQFYLPKKSGGKRLISAPMPILKKAQYWILETILNKIPINPTAHGFVADRSIVSNAQPHVGKAIVINLDLKDFFPTITYARVKGLFEMLGYAEPIATLLSLLCTEPATDMVEIDGKLYHSAKGERFLPQGAPTSPYLTNLICYKLDRRLEGIAKKWDFDYTRYADDMTFSASDKTESRAHQLLWSVKQVIEDEGFVVHPDKQKIMRAGNRQEVTGVIVNDELSVNRKTRRQFRALLHQIEQTGVQNKSWGKGQIENSIEGYANFVMMVKPEQGHKLKQQVRNILGLKASTPKSKPVPKPAEPISTPQPPTTLPKQDTGDWWNVL